MSMKGIPLAEGTVANTQTAIYTVGSVPAAVNGGQIKFHNTSATPQDIVVAYKFVSLSSSTIRTLDKVLQLAQNESAIVDVPDLFTGDIVYLTTTTASVLNYVFYGGLVS